METRSRMSRSLHTNRDFEKLEPYEGKPSRTVLRGEEGSNALDLPDSTCRHGTAQRSGGTQGQHREAVGKQHRGCGNLWYRKDT